MLQNIEECQEVHKNIIEKAKNIIELKEKRQGLEDETHKMFSELQHLTSDSSVFEANQENLLKRNKLIRDKCNNIEVDVNEESAKISECKKSFFKKLGLQLSMDLSPLSDNFVELKIQFSESHDYYATFVYDTVTEDYDRKLAYYKL